MAEHNKKILDYMIGKLEDHRQCLYRSAAQLDKTIMELHANNITEGEYLSCFIKEMVRHRSTYVKNLGLPSDEISIKIMLDALDDLE